MAHGRPARTPTRRVRIRRARVVALLLVVAPIVAGLGYRSLASTSPAAFVDALRSEDGGALGEALPGTVWPARGQAAVQVGQSRVEAGPNQHAAAIASVAKVMTA